MPKEPLSPKDTFCIKFDIDKKTNYIIATEVTIKQIVMDSMDSARVDLADHRLYKDLQQYVKSNPR